MADYPKAYKDFAAAARAYHNFWQKFAQDQPEDWRTYKRGEPVSAEEVLQKSRDAAIAYRKFIEEKRLPYDQTVGNELRRAALTSDFIKLEFLILLIVMFPVSYRVVGDMAFVLDQLIDDYVESGCRPGWGPGHLVEKMVDLVSDYPDERLVSPLSRLCSVDIGDEDIMPMIVAVYKSLDALKLIQSKESVEVIRKCCDHEHPAVRDTAHRVISWLSKRGLEP